MSDFIFIDDSGSKQWVTPYAREFIKNPPDHQNEQNKNFWRGNYFVFGCVCVSSDKMKSLDVAINKAKIKYFGTDKVEFHSSDLRNPHQLRKKYLEKYNISQESLSKFINAEWYPLLVQSDVSLTAIILDKRYFATHRRNAQSPLEIATEALFDRIEIQKHDNCKIVFDQMDSQLKTAKRDQGKILEISNTKINLADGKYEDKYHNSSVRFEKSSNSNFLQLADAISYNVWRQFVDYGDEWEKHLPHQHRELPMYNYFEIVSQKFHHHDKTGRVSGYGIVKLPDPNNKKRFWRI